jgi:hypothetical protein
MPDLFIRAIQDDDIKPVIALWRDCGLLRPWNEPEKDIAFARANLNSEVLIGESGPAVTAAAMVGHDGHRGYVYYVAAHPDVRGQGHGKKIMVAAKDWLVQRDVWKMNILIRKGNEKVIAFYEALGAEVEPIVSMGWRF